MWATNSLAKPRMKYVKAGNGLISKMRSESRRRTILAWEAGGSAQRRNVRKFIVALEKAPGRNGRPALLAWERDLLDRLWAAWEDPPSDQPILEDPPKSEDTPQVEKQHPTPQSMGFWPGPVTTVAFALSGLSMAVFFTSTWLLFFLLAFLGATWVFEVSLRRTKNREYIVEFISKEIYADAYKSALETALDSFDEVVVGAERERWHKAIRAGKANIGDFERAKHAFRWAWPVRLFSFAILLASFYPIAMIFYQWVWLRSHVLFGYDPLLLTTGGFLGKLPIVGVYVASLLSAIQSARVQSPTYVASVSGTRIGLPQKGWPWALLSVLFALAGLGLLALAPVEMVDGGLFLNAHYGTMATGVMIAFVLISYFRLYDVVVGPALAAGTGGFVIAYWSDDIKQLARWIAEDSEASFTIWFAWLSSSINATTSILVAIPLVLVLRRLLDRSSALPHVVFIAFPLLAVALLAYGAGYLETWRSYYLYIGLIPIVNAVFDFASIGLTRWALRRGLQKIGAKTIAYSLLDLVVALLIFLSLGCFTIVVLDAVNQMAASIAPPGSDQVVNLNPEIGPNIFQQISEYPAHHTWLYLAFLTTLLPTLCHASIAVFAIGPTVLSVSARKRWSVWYMNASENLFDEILRIVPISAWASFAITAPVFLLVFGFNAIFESQCEWGHELMNVFISFLHALIPNPEDVPLFNVYEACSQE